MPSRNKKNKNRAQPPNNASASKNEPTLVKISEDLVVAKETVPEPNLKSAIDVAKEKLEQLQQSVDSIKASIAKPNDNKSDEKRIDPPPTVDVPESKQEQKDEANFETQTMKKKRNRNRNRNRNKHNLTVDESGVSSTSGTNESSTHENSPTPAAISPITLPTTELITTAIKEEPVHELPQEFQKKTQTEIQTKTQKDAKSASLAIETKHNRKTDKQPIKVAEVNITSDQKSKNVPIESEKSLDGKEKVLKESQETPKEKDSKNIDKQKKNQPSKNANKKPIEIKQNEQPIAVKQNEKQNEKTIEAKLPESDTNKSAVDSALVEKTQTVIETKQDEKKEELPVVKKSESENKDKTMKEQKKSPKMNRNNQAQADEIRKKQEIDTVAEKHVEQVEVKSTPTLATLANIKSDDSKNDSNQSDQQLMNFSATVESKNTDTSEASLNIVQESAEHDPAEQTALPFDESQFEILTPQTSAEVKVEVLETKIETKIETKTEAKIEVKPEIKDEVKAVESKQEVIQTTPVESPKECKKSKAKKSPPQAKKPFEQQQQSPQPKPKQTNNFENPSTTIQSETKCETADIARKGNEIMQNVISPATGATTLTTELPKEVQTKTAVTVTAPAKDESPEEILSVVAAPAVVVLAEKVPEKSKSESSTATVKNVKSDQTEEIASTSKSKVELKSKKTELTVACDEGTKTPTSSPVATPTTEPVKKPIVQPEDETAKIWKILEEASKSLEPVEIQMDVDPVTPINNAPIETVAPIVCSNKDDEQAKDSAQVLATLLETKEINKSKQTPQSKTKPKENNQQVKEINNQQSQKQSSPIKVAEIQPKKPIEPPRKKDVKPAQKHAKSSKQQPQPTEKPIKIPDKTSEKTPPRTELAPEKNITKIVEKSVDKTSEKTPPREGSVGAASAADEEIPLDVSILPNEIEVAELNTDSKNGAGSGFVPSVEHTTAETESLVPKTIIKIESIEAQDDCKSKGKSPTKLEAANATPEAIDVYEVVEAVENMSLEENKTLDVKKSNGNASAESLSPEPQAMTSKSPSKSVSPEKSHPNQSSKQKGITTKTAKESKSTQGKTNQKSNGKPTIPPKPEHLLSSQTKKSQAAATKAKTEKILVLTGNIEDEDSEDDYIEYKFMPRQVFIATICQSCKKATTASERILCSLCQMVSYCCSEHVKNDEPTHKDLCAALQEIAKKRGGHIYNNARILNNNDYRSLRVHTLNLCENFLKRPLQTFEREVLLFPRLCSTPTCREWRQNLLTDCPNCTQVFYCTAQPEHLIETHQRWCNSVALYQKLVVTQSVSGRIEPSLPSRIQNKPYTLPNTIGDVFKDLYKNISVIKDDCVFATLTQLATAPLTAYFATQKSDQKIGEKFTIHLIGAELQFEADVLDIWETFFLHLAHNLMELTIVFCGPELNAENIPLDIISRIRMCRTCRQNCRIVKFDFQCAKFYHDYANSSAYSKPDLLCFFNPGFHHINSLNGMDTWSETIKIASSSGCPVVVTSYTEYESPRDLDRFQVESTNGGKLMTLIHGPEFNAYSSQRPERNFISDEMVPLIFKNYFCFILK